MSLVRRNRRRHRGIDLRSLPRKTSWAAHEGASLAMAHAIVSNAERCLIRTEGLFPSYNASCEKKFFCVARKLYAPQKDDTVATRRRDME
jgi:hypothetical protein